jgi:predicted deacylase
MDRYKLDATKIERGKIDKGYLTISDYNDGTPINTPVIVVNGIEAGPRLWLQSCIHGDEYPGSMAILKLCREIDPGHLTGTIICLPALNITAFRSKTRFSPFNPHGMPDLNRVFPGKRDGNFTEVMAYNIFNALLKNADYLIDFHSGHNADTAWSLYAEDNSETSKKSLELAKAFGYDLIWPCSNPLLEKGMFFQANIKEIPSIIVEAGGGGPLATKKAVEDAYEGLLNVLKHLEMLDQPFIMKEEFTLFQDWKWLSAQFGGRFEPLVEIRDLVNKGDVIGRVYSLFEEELEAIKSPVDGIILTVSTEPFVLPGDSLYQIGKP